MADDDADRADGLGGGDTTAPPNPNAAAGAAMNGGETSRVTGPEADATIASNGGETTRATGPDAAASAASNGGETSRATGPEADATAATNGGESTNPTEADDHRALHDYAARYSGRTLVARMIFIAERCGVEAMEQEALEMALQEAKEGKDIMLYGHIYNLINRRFGPPYDQAWVERVNQEFTQSVLFIEADLQSHKDNQEPDMIRTRYMELGDLYYCHGYLYDALKAYIQTEDYITNPLHLTEMCLKAVLINVELGNFDRVLHYVNMAKGSPNPLDAITTAKLHAAAGLAHMRKKEYELAALQFVEVGTEMANKYSEVMAPHDVAIYGAFCALATFNSADIKDKLVENTHFGYFLGLVPDVWQLVVNFFHSQHALCIEYLDKVSSTLVLDCHIVDHLHTLGLVISQKSGYMVFEFNVDLLRTQSPVQNEGYTAGNNNSPLLNVISNLVLPDNFNDDLELVPSEHYSFVKCKDLLLSLGKRTSKWVPKCHSCALLQNAELFATNSVVSEDTHKRVDGRTALVSEDKFSLIDVEFASYTTTSRPLKERRLKDDEESPIDRFEMKGDKWARRRTCLRANPGFHLLQWRKTSGLRRVQVQLQEEPAAENSRDTVFEELMKTLIEQLKDTSKTVTESRQDIAKSKEEIVDACKAAITAMSGGVGN